MSALYDDAQIVTYCKKVCEVRLSLSDNTRIMKASFIFEKKKMYVFIMDYFVNTLAVWSQANQYA